ncbi:GABA transporter 1 [Platanthera zijinensis]|uniref:GABA transporter 1 n=1 Tax=Platanthera zijinensis TaxID=2320716 RepID=A0AAP0BSY0_9ASPA
MGTVATNPADTTEGMKGEKDQSNREAIDPTMADPPAAKLDAGALFVLKSEGSWLHCGYHLTTSIVAPALLSLPLALASLGWAAGVFCLFIAAAVTFYSYNLISLVLEHQAKLGRRQLRFRDMAHQILGPSWARYYIGPIQFMVCFCAVVGNVLLGGQTMKSMYLIEKPEGTMKLYEFVVIFGAFMLVLAQLPSFHSLRHINLLSLFLCLAYSACATGGSIYIGHSSQAPSRDYSLPSDKVDLIFGIFNAIAIIATSYGNGIIPEIQATAAPPVEGKMFKGLSLCYAVALTTFFSVAISGYWAFGNLAEGTILANFVTSDKRLLVPKWFLMMTNIYTILQLSAVAVVYLQPTNEVLEGVFANPEKGQHSARNVIPRIIFRSLSVVAATVIGAMLPFFGDINAFMGAFGFLPLDFVVPAVVYNITFRPSPRGSVFWINTTIAAVFSVLTVVASVAAVRQIALDAKNYKLFANV